MKKYFFLIFIALFAIFSFTRCSKDSKGDSPEETESVNTNLKQFSFNASNNPGLTGNISGVISGNLVYITVPDEANITSLVPTISCQEGNELYLNSLKITNGVTSLDFTNLVSLRIQSPSKSDLYHEYRILVKYGNVAIDREIYDFMIKYSIPGISVAASKDEKMIYSYGYGFANTTTGERVNQKHLFRLASVSKSHTAVGIMRLCEKGKMSVNDQVFGNGGILEKEFGNAMPLSAKAVTVKNLLEHNSGWTSSPVDPCFPGDNALYYGKTLDERIAYVVNNVPQTYAPGAKYSYYNLGFGILGKIIEKVSGMDYEAYMNQEVWGPCGIKDIHVGGNESQQRNNEVKYYSQSGTNGYGNDMQVIKALGGLIASSEELVTFLLHLDYKTTVPDILQPATLNLMYKASSTYSHYALGWRVDHSFGWYSYHSGNLAGTATLYARGVNGVNLAILCNSRSYIDGFDDALYVLLKDVMEAL